MAVTIIGALFYLVGRGTVSKELSYHHVNFGVNRTYSVGARAFAVKT